MNLKYLLNLRIPRRYKQGAKAQLDSVQLHHSCDASQKAYWTASYLRSKDKSGVHCSFVFGKAKLIHLKQQTIARLELCETVVAVKMNQYLIKELDVHVDESLFWTDSTLVLQYISNTEKRFSTFVTNRVNIIRDQSRRDQWRHVNTAVNPADDATRGLAARDMNEGNRWFPGRNSMTKAAQENTVDEGSRNNKLFHIMNDQC